MLQPPFERGTIIKPTSQVKNPRALSDSNLPHVELDRKPELDFRAPDMYPNRKGGKGPVSKALLCTCIHRTHKKSIALGRDKNTIRAYATK